VAGAAREKVKAEVPAGLCVLSQRVLSDGEPKTVRAMAETTEVAYEKVKTDVPEGAEVLGEVEVTPPGSRTVDVKAFDELAAKELADKERRPTEVLGLCELVVQGSKGLMGIGKKPNSYRVAIQQQSVVEIRYKRKARISAVIGESKRTATAIEQLDNAEKADLPIPLICEECGKQIKALAKPVSRNTVMVMTPEIAMIAARFCMNCNIIVCGRCVGVSSYSLGPSVGGRKCPRCKQETEYAAICHVRETQTEIV